MQLAYQCLELLEASGFGEYMAADVIIVVDLVDIDPTGMIQFEDRPRQPLLEDRREMDATLEEVDEMAVEGAGKVLRRLEQRQARDMHGRFRRFHVEKRRVEARQLLHALLPNPFSGSRLVRCETVVCSDHSRKIG